MQIQERQQKYLFPFYLALVLLTFGVSGCAKKEEAPAEAAAEAPATEEPDPNPEEPTPPPTPKEIEKYTVSISANKRLERPGPPGELRVWIGNPDELPSHPDGMNSTSKDLKESANTALITPFALGITVEPSQSKCMKITPTGSEIKFKLIPTKSGVATVSVEVELYDSKDCSGVAIPKSSESLEVKVDVDTGRVVKDGLAQLAESAWKVFVEFWDKFLVVISALFLFLIRNKLFKIFKFKENS